MKNLLSLMFVAAAAMTFTACSDADDIMPNEESDNKAVFVAENPGVEDVTRSQFEIDGSGNIQTMWSAYPKNTNYSSDEIYACFDNMTNIHSFKADITTNSKTAEFVDKNGSKSALISDMESKGATELYFSTQSMKYDTNTFICDFPLLNQNLKYYNTIDGTKDILVSNKVTLEELKKANGPIKLRFKRLNGIIRLNFKPGEGVTADQISGISAILLGTVPPRGTKGFGGYYSIDFTKGEISVSGYQHTELRLFLDKNYFEDDIKGSDFEICFPKENIPAYMSSLPVTINKGEQIMVMGQNKYEKNIIKKTITAQEDVVVESGKITTFNITVNKADLLQ